MTARLIKKSPGRFLSLIAIVLLGTAFYIGVSSVSTVMSSSVNKYDDEQILLCSENKEGNLIVIKL